MTPFPLSAQTCAPDRIFETARVRHIHDGDTVRLEDGRKLRLIGIDTPELGRDKQPAQPYAREARQALVELLRQSNRQVGLSYGRQRHDHYRRTLAHLYLPDGRSLQAELLRQGYATAFTTPPNDRRSHCYRQAEEAARENRLGIWSLSQYQPKTLDQLNDKDRGFRRVNAQVSKVNFGNKAVWIHLGKKLRLRINNRDLPNFDMYGLRTLNGKTIEVRGWLHPGKDHFFMALRHSDALIVK